MVKLATWLTERIGWLQIVASPFFVGLIFGLTLYLPNPNTTRLIIGITITTLGLITGVFWANKILKTKKGTIWFLSRVTASPELDKKDTKETEIRLK